MDGMERAEPVLDRALRFARLPVCSPSHSWAGGAYQYTRIEIWRLVAVGFQGGTTAPT
jgi:hypothetical protein